MNAQGLKVMLNGVVRGMKVPHFRPAAIKAGISEDEFDGTLANLTAAEGRLGAVPREKLEAMVEHFDPQLTAHVDKFHQGSDQHVLPAFHEAQMLAGYVATVMAKSGVPA